MHKKQLFAPVLAILFAAAFLAGCDHSVANDELRGRWVARGGFAMEFNGGQFTETLPDGTVRTGTFTTGDDYITFNIREGRTEVRSFCFDFPRLTISGVDYFHDSPRYPDLLDGRWVSFVGRYATHATVPVYFSSARRQRDNRWVWEGEADWNLALLTEYTVHARNLPGTSVLTYRTTRLASNVLYAQLQFRIPVHLWILFEDLDELRIMPEEDTVLWITSDEIRGFFARAMGNTNELAHIHLLTNVKNFFLDGLEDEEVWYFTIEENVEVYDLRGDLLGYNDVLTMVNGDGAVRNYIRFTGDPIFGFSGDWRDLLPPENTWVRNADCLRSLTAWEINK